MYCIAVCCIVLQYIVVHCGKLYSVVFHVVYFIVLCYIQFTVALCSVLCGVTGGVVLYAVSFCSKPQTTRY